MHIYHSFYARLILADKQTNISVTIELVAHRSKAVIWIRYEKNNPLIARVKKLVGVRYSASEKSRYVPENQSYRQKFGFAKKTKLTEFSIQ